MGKTVRNIINIIWYLFVFAFIQIICWLAIWVTWSFIQGNDIESVLKNIRGAILDNEYALITNTIVCSLLTVCLFFMQDWTPFKRTYLQSRPWTTLFWVGLMVFGTIIPSIWLDEQLGVELSESAEQMLTKMMGNPLGYFAVGIMAPLAEEVVFRGAVLRTLLKMMDDRWHWIAILISALIFGGFHGNEAQFVHGTLIGLLIGWMYYRTKSIVPGLVFHFVNNSIAYVMYNLMPNTHDASLIDIFKGSQTNVYLALAFSLCIFLPALYQLFLRLKEKV